MTDKNTAIPFTGSCQDVQHQGAKSKLKWLQQRQLHVAGRSRAPWLPVEAFVVR
jgi:hypothetical protein